MGEQTHMMSSDNFAEMLKHETELLKSKQTALVDTKKRRKELERDA